MAGPDFLYSVALTRKVYRVRYIDLAAKEVKRLEEIFNDPDKAIAAFKAIIGEAESLYLQPQRFSMNVRSLAQYKRLDRQREVKSQQQNSQQ
jgi:hypothetical protein